MAMPTFWRSSGIDFMKQNYLKQPRGIKTSPFIHLYATEITEEWSVTFSFLYSIFLIHNRTGIEFSCRILSVIMGLLQSEYMIGNLSIRSAHCCGLRLVSWRNVMYSLPHLILPPPYLLVAKNQAQQQAKWERNHVIGFTFHHNHPTYQET